MRLIDADKIKYYTDYRNIDGRIITEQVTKKVMVDLVPTADVEPVIRCKDCRYYKYRENDDTEWRECITTGNITGCNDYCSYGERKDDE